MGHREGEDPEPRKEPQHAFCRLSLAGWRCGILRSRGWPRQPGKSVPDPVQVSNEDALVCEPENCPALLSLSCLATTQREL